MCRIYSIRNKEMRNVQFLLSLYEKKIKHFKLWFSDTDSLCYESNEDFYIKFMNTKTYLI